MSTAAVTANLSFNSPAPTLTSAAASPEAAALRACSVFASAVPAAIAAIARGATRKHAAPGAVVLSEGSLNTDVLLVVRGRLRAVRRGDNGREITVETFRTGDLIPDAALEPGTGTAHDVVAGEPTVLLAIPRDVFLAHMRLQPEVALALAQSLAGRIRRQRELSAGLVMTDVQGRVVRALRQLAQRDGETTPEGVFVRQRPTQQELANSIGACRETVSRIVSEMARQGLVANRGRGLLLTRRLLEN